MFEVETVLGLPHHELGHVTSQSVNTNDQPGIGVHVKKKRSSYGPLLKTTRAMVQHEIKEVGEGARFGWERGGEEEACGRISHALPASFPPSLALSFRYARSCGRTMTSGCARPGWASARCSVA